MKIIRQVGNYSLVKKGKQYYIDNGIDDVSEYMDEFDIADLLECENWEFINKCIDLF